MKYSVHFTESVLNDIERAARYIKYTLHNPSASDNLLDDISAEIRKLEDNPFICAVVDDPVLNSIGIRFRVIGNYLLFYIVSDQTKTISILRFLYGKMNWQSILGQDSVID